jgi:UDP-N-acetylglucosamine acyltransferase
MPFSKTVSERDTRVFGANVVGLKRHGFSLDRRKKLSAAFRLLASSNLNTAQAVEAIRQESGDSDDVQELLRFLESSERGFIK